MIDIYWDHESHHKKWWQFKSNFHQFNCSSGVMHPIALLYSLSVMCIYLRVLRTISSYVITQDNYVSQLITETSLSNATSTRGDQQCLSTSSGPLQKGRMSHWFHQLLFHPSTTESLEGSWICPRYLAKTVAYPDMTDPRQKEPSQACNNHWEKFYSFIESYCLHCQHGAFEVYVIICVCALGCIIHL